MGAAVKDKYSTHARDDFVYVEFEPEFEISLETMHRMWVDVVPISEQHNSRLVLVEDERPARAMRTLDTYNHGYPVRLAARDLPIRRRAR